GPRGEVCLETQRVEANASELVEAGLALAGLFEHLSRLFRRQLHEFGLKLGVEEDRLRGRDLGGEFRLLRLVQQANVVGVEDVDERLGCQQIELANVGKIKLRGTRTG